MFILEARVVFISPLVEAPVVEVDDATVAVEKNDIASIVSSSYYGVVVVVRTG
jgi:hypothetical protein